MNANLPNFIGNPLLPVPIIVIILAWVIQRNSNLLFFIRNNRDSDKRIRDRKRQELEENEELDLIDLAIELMFTDLQNRPGQGHEWYGRARNNPSIPRVNMRMINWILREPRRCIENIGFSPKEFNHLLQFVEIEVVLAGGRDGENFRQGKMTIRARFFVLLYYMNSQATFRNMEVIFCQAKSSINDDIKYLGQILLIILQREFAGLWPTLAERNEIREHIPENLKGTGVWGSVDSFKCENDDSLDPHTRSLHYNTHKGFGANGLLCTTAVGHVAYFAPFLNGNADDTGQYRVSDIYQRRNNCTMESWETLAGDDKYVGSVSSALDSAQLLQKVTNRELNQMDAATYALALEYNYSFNILRGSVELAIRVIKRCCVVGSSHKCRISLYTNPDFKELLNNLAAYLSIAKMRMRGQVLASNPAVIGHSRNGINLADRIVRRFTGRLYTAEGRQSAFFGPALSGLGFDDIPDPII
jgi:hypothetical protein